MLAAAPGLTLPEPCNPAGARVDRRKAAFRAIRMLAAHHDAVHRLHAPLRVERAQPLLSVQRGRLGLRKRPLNPRIHVVPPANEYCSHREVTLKTQGETAWPASAARNGCALHMVTHTAA